MTRLEGAPSEPPPVVWCEVKFPEDVTFRVFERAGFCCQVCGVEMGRSVLRRVATWDDPSAWVLLSGDAPRAWDDHIVHVTLVVWSPEWPILDSRIANREYLERLEARCMGCVIRAAVAAIPRYRKPVRVRAATPLLELIARADEKGAEG